MQGPRQIQKQRFEGEGERASVDIGEEKFEEKFKYSELEYERHCSRCLDQIWAEKVLIVIGVSILLFGIVFLYVDTSPIQDILMKIFDFMMSYINFSKKVLHDVVSFIIGILFVGVFILTTIGVILLSFIPFLAITFVFINI
jgi:Fe2+ transport system protein B